MPALQTKKNPFGCISFIYLTFQGKQNFHNFNLNIHKISDRWIWHEQRMYPFHNRSAIQKFVFLLHLIQGHLLTHMTRKNCNGCLQNHAVSHGSSQSVSRSWLQPHQRLICSPPAVTSGHDTHYPSHAADGGAGGNPSKRKAKTKGASFLLGKWVELRSYWKEAGGS